LAINPIDTQRIPAATTQTTQGGIGRLGGANAQDVGALKQALSGQSAAGPKASPEDAGAMKGLREQLDRLMRQTPVDQAAVTNLNGRIETLLSKYPPSPEDASLLKEIGEKSGKIATRQPLTPADRAELAVLSQQAMKIRLKPFE